jgi:hypothetical protein
MSCGHFTLPIVAQSPTRHFMGIEKAVRNHSSVDAHGRINAPRWYLVWIEMVRRLLLGVDNVIFLAFMFLVTYDLLTDWASFGVCVAVVTALRLVFGGWHTTLNWFPHAL